MSSAIPPQRAEAGRRGVAPGAGTAPELAEETRLGGSDAGHAINAALLALSRTARSFTLYDAQNEAVRGFLEDLRAKFQRVLERGGALTLEVRPFELLWQGDAVYLERERERSLAFRLFRDGVRRLTFEPQLDWNELLGLVEILSLRYTGVRQQEDDVVTLLHKGGFRSVRFIAVEGFVPDEEIADEADASLADAVRLPPPAEFDRVPELPPPVAPAWRELPAEALAALRQQESAATLPDDAVQLLVELAALAADPRDPLPVEEVAPTLVEVRDFLIAEGAFTQLVQLRDALAQAPAELRAPLAEPDLLRRVVQWARNRPEDAPPDLPAFVSDLPGDSFTALLTGLPAEKDASLRAAMLRVLELLAPAQGEALLRSLSSAEPAQAATLLRIIVRGVPEQATDALLLVKDTDDPDLQLALIQALPQAGTHPALGRTAPRLLGSLAPEVVVAAAEHLAAQGGEPRAFDTVARRLQDPAMPPDNELAAALGAALACLAPRRAAPLFSEWLQSRGLLGRLVDNPARRALQWAAVGGLARLPGSEPEQVLRAFLPQAGNELRQYGQGLLASRPAASAPAAPGAASGGPRAR